MVYQAELLHHVKPKLHAKADHPCGKPQGILAKANKPGGKMIKAIEHMSFTVSSLEDSLDFFCDKLGLEATPIMFYTLANALMWHMGFYSWLLKNPNS